MDLTGKVRVGSDAEFVTAVVRALFAHYIGPYMSIEKRFIKEQCAGILQRFYESKRHQKRQITQ